jgi:hypothetical protein
MTTRALRLTRGFWIVVNGAALAVGAFGATFLIPHEPADLAGRPLLLAGIAFIIGAVFTFIAWIEVAPDREPPNDFWRRTLAFTAFSAVLVLEQSGLPLMPWDVFGIAVVSFATGLVMAPIVGAAQRLVQKARDDALRSRS